MTNKEFFGTSKFKDVCVKLYNEKNERIYDMGVTTFAYVNPKIAEYVKRALADYKERWKYNGDPVRCEVFTTPTWNLCTIDLLTNEKTFS